MQGATQKELTFEKMLKSLHEYEEMLKSLLELEDILKFSQGGGTS
jgi:hypothetical protein